MAAIRRVYVTWTGATGLPGVTVFYSLGSADATASVGTFLTAIKGLVPNVVTWRVPASGDTLEATTGALTGSWSGGTAATIAATGSGNFAAGTGAYVRWATNTIRAGRKFQGRTFLCPLLASQYDGQGNVTAAAVTTLQTAANALVAASPTIVIFGRPTPGLSNGTFAGITGATVSSTVTSLRSRRR